jgi:hypothetical protein
MLRLGAHQWQTYRHGECAQCRLAATLRDRSAAREWLQQFKSDAMAMAALRQMLAQETGVPLRLDRAADDDVIEQAAQCLASGLWHVHAPHGMGAAWQSPKGGDGAAEEQNDKDSPKKPPITPKELTWVEIQLVDAAGKPVPGMAYEIKLPDGSIQSGKLDALGKARREEIIPGQCEVRFPELDGGDWKPA